MRGFSGNELGWLGILLGLAGSGLFAFTDQKDIAFVALVLGSVGAGGFFANRFVSKCNPTSLMGSYMILIWIGVVLIVSGWIIGLYGALNLDRKPPPPPQPLSIQGAPQPRNYAEGIEVVGFPWTKGFSHLLIVIQNNGSEAITDLDVIFHPDVPILRSTAKSAFATSCRISAAGYTPRDIPLFMIDRNGNSEVVSKPDRSTDHDMVLGPPHRLVCDKLGAQTNVVVQLLTASPNPDFGAIQFTDPNGAPPKKVEMLVRYSLGSIKQEFVADLPVAFLPF